MTDKTPGGISHYLGSLEDIYGEDNTVVPNVKNDVVSQLTNSLGTDFVQAEIKGAKYMLVTAVAFDRVCKLLERHQRLLDQAASKIEVLERQASSSNARATQTQRRAEQRIQELEQKAADRGY